MSRRLASLFTAFLALLLSAHAFAGGRHHAAPKVELRYKLVEVFRALPNGQREEVAPLSLNERGEMLVEGSLRITTNNDDFIDGYPQPRVFIWRKGRIVTELVSTDDRLFDVEGWRINNRGEVVGSLARYDPGYTQRAAFVWRHGRFTKIELPAFSAAATSINDWGEAVGFGLDNDFDFYSTPFRWYRGQLTRVPVDPVLSASAIDINNWGQLVGFSQPRMDSPPYNGPYGAYIADRKGRVQFLEPPPGADYIFPEAINDRRQVIGRAGDRAVLWEDGTTLDLGTLPGASSATAAAINVFGTIVGTATFESGDGTAFIWKEGRMRDLNELIADNDPVGATVHLTSAQDINNVGWIATTGTEASDPENVQTRTYLLVPVWKKRR